MYQLFADFTLTDSKVVTIRSLRALALREDKEPGRNLFIKIQLGVSYQCCVLIG